MSTAAASILFLALLTVSIAHLLWAIGSPWPIRDPQVLANAVIGKPGVTRVPRLGALLVGLFVLAAAAIGTAVADPASGGLLLTILGFALTALFAVRGIAGYTRGWQAAHPVAAFLVLDRKFYSPLCLVVAVCFLVLSVMRLT
jgi:hypothetical protein